jgi:hypothetical protein
MSSECGRQFQRGLGIRYWNWPIFCLMVFIAAASSLSAGMPFGFDIASEPEPRLGKLLKHRALIVVVG